MWKITGYDSREIRRFAVQMSRPPRVKTRLARIGALVVRPCRGYAGFSHDVGRDREALGRGSCSAGGNIKEEAMPLATIRCVPRPRKGKGRGNHGARLFRGGLRQAFIMRTPADLKNEDIAKYA